MWDVFNIVSFIFIFIFSLTFSTNSFYSFIILAELIWITTFTLSSLTNLLTDGFMLSGLPIVILCITAVEGCLLWGLMVLKTKIN